MTNWQALFGMNKFSAVPIERVAEFWDSSPCNIRHSSKSIGTREYFDEVEARKYFVEPHIPRFAEFDRWSGKRVLEIGCGIGTDTMNFARHRARITAVDVSERSIEIARRRAEIYGLGNRISFYSGDAERLTDFVPVETYDLVYSFGVIHHTPHPERVIDQLRRFVRPGSAVKIMLYHRRSWKAFSLMMTQGRGRFWATEEVVARYSEAQTGCPVTYIYRLREVVQLLKGFEIKDLWIDHIFPYKVEDYKAYRYVKLPYFQIMPHPLFRWLERHFGWHLCVTAEAR